MPLWNWIALLALAVYAAAQQFYLHRMRAESKKREELFQIVTENAADMIALVDVKGHRLYNSPAYKRILGYSPAELSETSAFDQIHPDDRLKVLEAAQQARATGVGRKLEYRIRHKNGTWRVLESVAGTIRDENGTVTKLVIVNRDVTERKQAEEQAAHNALHDGLTGLPNRRLFLERLQNSFDRAQRTPERQHALLLADLDGFKAFNDTMGPAIGDQVIVEIGRRLGACLRDQDLVSRPQTDLGARHAVLSRMGGDEFTILLEGVNDPSDAMRVGQRILSAVSALLLVEGRELRTSASVGIALSTPEHARAEELLQEADVAMRRAKALGGGRCELFDEAMHSRAVNRLKLEEELREAMEKQQFVLYYQPVFDLQTGAIPAFEALLRWQHPEQGLISPHKFTAAAEDQGLLVSIGQWVLRKACLQLQAWTSEIPVSRKLTIGINLSARQWSDPGFLNHVAAALGESGIEPGRLHLEIAEKIASADARSTIHVLAGLKRLEVGVILDNFGVGNLSLVSLSQFHLEGLKVARSLVSGMMADREAAEAVELILSVAQKLHFVVIAEGIENAKQRERLRQLGCHLGQGYFFARPMEADAATALLRTGKAKFHSGAMGPG
jgi:diguanylate cyclase (GGDEF)-like protein/PAS domain S-box-containing protein